MSERGCSETRCHLLQHGDLSCLLFQRGAGAKVREQINNWKIRWWKFIIMQQAKSKRFWYVMWRQIIWISCVFMSDAGCCEHGPNSYLEQTKKSGGLRFCLPVLGREGLQPYQLSVSASRAISTGSGSAGEMVPVTFHTLLDTSVCSPVFLSLNLCVLYWFLTLYILCLG